MKKKVYALVAFCSVMASQVTFASDHGCKVLLCLAASNGTPAQCEPDLRQLWHDLAKGRPFPTCDLASADSARPALQQIVSDNPTMPDESRSALQNVIANLRDSYARQGYNYFDPCPDGTTALPAGQHAVQGAATGNQSRFTRVSTNSPTYIGIGDGEGWGSSEDGYGGAKVCVGTQVGYSYASFDGYRTTQVPVYDRVVLMNPESSPRYIDVIISGSLARRVRW